MHFSGLLLASAATLAVAAPTNNVFNNVYDHTGNLEEFYSKVSDYISHFAGDLASSTCYMTKVQFPTTATGLPTPNGTLKYVAVGRGTQVRGHNIFCLYLPRIPILHSSRITPAPTPLKTPLLSKSEQSQTCTTHPALPPTTQIFWI